MNRWLCGVVLLAACGEGDLRDDVAGSGDTSQASSEGALIYGADDRREDYQILDPVQRRVADSTVAVMKRAQLTANANGYAINVQTLFRTAWQLCAGEPYRDQPVSADCTGFQVGTDLVATAGHCVDNSTCANQAYVFGFALTAPAVVRSQVPANDVYFCSQVVSRAYTATNDYAVVRVDRPIVGRNPLDIRRGGGVAVGAPLAVAGHPVGIPLKVAAGATVRNAASPDYFEANLDTYGGNSGSPVFDPATGVIEGILVRGNTDFVYNRQARCYVSNRCDDTGCPGWEDATRSTRFAASVPDISPGCQADAECSDGNACNGAERCAAGVCAAGTPVSCDVGEQCVAGACQEIPVCGARNTACDSHGDCCSGSCRRGSCR